VRFRFSTNTRNRPLIMIPATSRNIRAHLCALFKLFALPTHMEALFKESSYAID
jgi:hypothetical protein